MHEYMSGLKGFFSSLFGGKVDATKVLESIDSIVKPTQALTFEVVKADHTTPFDSKLGGVPYMPKGFPYPHGLSGDFEGKPLFLLAQLNFARLPHIEGFPSSGILQFFIANNTTSYSYGLDLDQEDRTIANGFRVIYHKDVVEDESLLLFATEMPALPELADFPIRGEYLLVPDEADCQHVNPADFRFEEAIVKSVNTLCNLNLEYSSDIDEKLYEEVTKPLSKSATQIGGFPFFTQDDPRYREEDEDFTVTLLQIDYLQNEDGSYGVFWGDNGICNFFIRPDDLAKCDFSHVIYNWDCY